MPVGLQVAPLESIGYTSIKNFLALAPRWVGESLQAKGIAPLVSTLVRDTRQDGEIFV